MGVKDSYRNSIEATLRYRISSTKTCKVRVNFTCEQSALFYRDVVGNNPEIRDCCWPSLLPIVG